MKRPVPQVYILAVLFITTIKYLLMSPAALSVREIQEQDFDRVIDYFAFAEEKFLTNMGVDIDKLPGKKEWRDLLRADFSKPIQDKQAYFLIWQWNDLPVGHSNINKIIFGQEAFMHLHLWNEDQRATGKGTEFVRLSIPFYFHHFKLHNLYCEPYALNPAPNRTLEKLGFDFIQEYETTPGWLNFHQKVKRWCLERGKFERLY